MPHNIYPLSLDCRPCSHCHLCPPPLIPPPQQARAERSIPDGGGRPDVGPVRGQRVHGPGVPAPHPVPVRRAPLPHCRVLLHSR